MPTIALIGLRASGKTTIGRALAAALGADFVDLDALVARRAGRSVRCIFEQDGEQRFRALEETALRAALRPGPPRVIATGGGVVERAACRVLLRRAYCVWLQVAPRVLARRLRRGRARPSLTGRAPADEIALLARRRAALYRALAHRVVRPGGAAPRAVAARILRSM